MPRNAKLKSGSRSLTRLTTSTTSSRSVSPTQTSTASMTHSLSPWFQRFCNRLPRGLPNAYVSRAVEESADVVQIVPHLQSDQRAALFSHSEIQPVGGIGQSSTPFTSLAVNMAPCTDVHRDQDYQEVCCMFVCGCFSGGELVLHESKLVVGLRGVHICAFPSQSQSHMNLPFEGHRASVVHRTEQAAKGWEKDYNGWGRYMG